MLDFVGGPEWQKNQFKMADGRYIGKCSRCYNSPIYGQIWTKVG